MTKKVPVKRLIWANFEFSTNFEVYRLGTDLWTGVSKQLLYSSHRKNQKRTPGRLIYDEVSHIFKHISK